MLAIVLFPEGARIREHFFGYESNFGSKIKCLFFLVNLLHNIFYLGSQSADEVGVKIADLGNACWVVRLIYPHFKIKVKFCNLLFGNALVFAFF